MIFCLHCRRNFKPEGDEGYCSPECEQLGMEAGPKEDVRRIKHDRVDMDWLRREIAMQNYEYEQRQRGGPYQCDACRYHTRTIYFYTYKGLKLLLCPASLRKIDPDYYRTMVEASRENELWKAKKRWESEHASDWMDIKTSNGLNLYAKRGLPKFQPPPQDPDEGL